MFQCSQVLTNRVFDAVGVDSTSTLNQDRFTSIVCPVLLSNLVRDNLEDACNNNSTSQKGAGDDYFSSLIEQGEDSERFQEHEMEDYLNKLKTDYAPETYSEVILEVTYLN